MKVKIDRDESLLYFLTDNTKLPIWKEIELTQKEIKDFKKCERAYFDWQNKIEDILK